jgi:hypothetical protein
VECAEDSLPIFKGVDKAQQVAKFMKEACFWENLNANFLHAQRMIPGLLDPIIPDSKKCLTVFTSGLFNLGTYISDFSLLRNENSLQYMELASINPDPGNHQK